MTVQIPISARACVLVFGFLPGAGRHRKTLRAGKPVQRRRRRTSRHGDVTEWLQRMRRARQRNA